MNEFVVEFLNSLPHSRRDGRAQCPRLREIEAHKLDVLDEEPPTLGNVCTEDRRRPALAAQRREEPRVMLLGHRQDERFVKLFLALEERVESAHRELSLLCDLLHRHVLVAPL